MHLANAFRSQLVISNHSSGYGASHINQYLPGPGPLITRCTNTSDPFETNQGEMLMVSTDAPPFERTIAVIFAASTCPYVRPAKKHGARTRVASFPRHKRLP